MAGRSTRVARLLRRVRGSDDAPVTRGRPEQRPQQRSGQGRREDRTLLLESPLFDEEWYAALTGQEGTRAELVRHYLRTPRRRRTSPNPLFDPDWYAARLDRVPEDDPFLHYLRRRTWRVPTHPLFDPVAYRRQVPGAKEHPHGPLAHYLEAGAPAGAAPCAWWPAEAPDLRTWMFEQHRRWRRDRDRQVPAPAKRRIRSGEQLVPPAEEIPVPVDGTVVSVLLDPGSDPRHLRATLDSLVAQSLQDWEVLVLDEGLDPTLGELLAEVLPPGRWQVLDVADLTPGSARNRALDRARGVWVAFLQAGDTWDPDRLRTLVGLADRAGAPPLLADVQRRLPRKGKPVHVGHGLPSGPVVDRSTVDPARLLVRWERLLEVGGFDHRLPAGWDFDVVARLAEEHGVPVAPYVGSERDVQAAVEASARPPARRPVVNHRRTGTWPDVVLNRRLVDWDGLAGQQRDPDLVSVIVPTHDDWQMTSAAVDAVVSTAREDGQPVQVVVVDNGCDLTVSASLAALALRHEEVEVLHLGTNHGFALGNNLALPRVRGAVTVFLNNDTVARPGWLGPLVRALGDPGVLGAQSLLLYPTGSVQSAGIAFPSTGGLPHMFLQGFPVEDTAGVEDLSFAALTGAALALRTDDVLALRGFDPVFRNGMEDVDLCLRLAGRRPGRFVVRPDSRVIHLESRAAGRYDHYEANRAVFRQRWASHTPGDDVALWESRGFVVAGHAVAFRHRQQRGLGVPEPVLAAPPARDRIRVAEGRPRLRWAIKNPAPATTDGDRWGDTYFAASLAEGLRAIGQHVAVDRLEEHERYSGRLDDVVVALRGLTPYRPAVENVSIGWVISHPDWVTPAEAASYDRFLAASVEWAQRRTREWDVPVEPLLQATDPALFHPDLAVPDTGHPVLFVGRSRKEYRPVVRWAVEQGLPLSIYGSQWREFVAPRFIKAQHLVNDQVGAAYRSAGVVLNDHWEDMRQDGFLSNRLFDAAASGARVVTDDVVGLGDLFGRSVQVARGPDDLVRLTGTADLDGIFGDDAERREVAARMHREHSFRARAERLFEIAVEERRRRGFDR